MFSKQILKSYLGARKVAQWLKTHIVFPEDLSSVPSFNVGCPQPRPLPAQGIQGLLASMSAYIHIHQPTSRHMHISIIKVKEILQEMYFS